MTKCLQEFFFSQASIIISKGDWHINKPQQIFLIFLQMDTVLRNLTQADFANIWQSYSNELFCNED